MDDIQKHDVSLKNMWQYYRYYMQGQAHWMVCIYLSYTTVYVVGTAISTLSIYTSDPEKSIHCLILFNDTYILSTAATSNSQQLVNTMQLVTDLLCIVNNTKWQIYVYIYIELDMGQPSIVKMDILWFLHNCMSLEWYYFKQQSAAKFITTLDQWQYGNFIYIGWHDIGPKE